MLLLEEPVRDLEPHHGLEYPCKSTFCTVLPTSFPIVGWCRMYRGRTRVRMVTKHALSQSIAFPKSLRGSRESGSGDGDQPHKPIAPPTAKPQRSDAATFRECGNLNPVIICTVLYTCTYSLRLQSSSNPPEIHFEVLPLFHTLARFR